MADPKNGSAPATKMEAVERTLADRGYETMPVAIKEHLKKKYGMEISAAVASDYKKRLKKKAKAAGTPETAKPAAMPPVAQAAAPLKKAAAPAKKTVPPVIKVAAAKPPASAQETPKKASGTKGGNAVLKPFSWQIIEP